MYFTSEQENIIQANEGVLLVTAGPGTGKTRTLTQKIIWLLREENRSPQHISLFTFSTKAVEELRTRLSQSVSELPWIATFHALAYRIVHHYTQSPPHVISSEYQSQMFNRLAKLYNVSANEISLNLSQERSSLNSDSQISDIRDTYRQWLTNEGLTDFDELLLRAYYILQSDESFRTQRQFYTQITCIDEFQDTNEIQLEIIRLLTLHSTHVCAIGDPYQSIYTFRGANPHAFETFKTYYPHTIQFSLRTSYRSAPEILRPAMRLFASEDYLHSKKPSSSLPQVTHCASELKEGQYIAREIRRILGGLDLNEYTYDHSRYSFSDIAVVYRSHEVGTKIDSCLRKDNLPTFRFGEQSFKEQPEIKHTLSILETSGSFHTQTLSSIVFDAIDRTISEKRLTKQTLKAETQRNRLRRLLQISRRWDTLPYLQAYDQLQLYLSFLEQDTMDSEDNRIHLMTIHAAKGLEFPIVFIAGLEEGLLPFISEDKSSNPDEERRLLYVAMSRAEDYLYLSYASNRTIYGTTKQRRPSRFLTSIPPAYFTYSQTGFTNTQKESSANSSSSQSSLF